MSIVIRELDKRDYKKAILFASVGMHNEWYFKSKLMMKLYSLFFWCLEVNRATYMRGAYTESGRFVGVICADIKGEPKRYRTLGKTLYIRLYQFASGFVVREGVGVYMETNEQMFERYCTKYTPDGEIIFLAADPNCQIKGVGTALLADLEQYNRGKELYLYTDSGCTYQFYDHRGFERIGEKDIVMDLLGRMVPLKCLLYRKKV